MVGRGEALEAINDLLASVTILNAASTQVLSGVLADLAGDQLTFTQLRLLRLVEHQAVLTVGDVANFLGVSNAAASKAVERLVRVGFLRRMEAQGDRRTVEISVTQEGHALLGAFEARSSATLRALLPDVDARRLRDLSERLDRLSVSLSSGGAEQARVCFRCGLYFREECLLRTVADSQCYLHLGTARRRAARTVPRRGANRDRVGATTGGIG